jgi:type II secretory pathway component GspD/PulD (secretin)
MLRPRVALCFLPPLLCLSAAACLAESTTRVFELRHADARQVAYLLGGRRLVLNPEAVTTQWANTLMRTAVRQMPRGRRTTQQDPQWRTYADLVPPDEGGGGAGADAPMARIFSVPPLESLVAFPGRNAVMAKGDPDALDRLAEAIRFLDQPVPQVNIDCRVEDTPVHIVRGWGLDFRAFDTDLEAQSQGNAPPSGTMLRLGLPRGNALLGLNDQVSRSRTITGLNVTTSSGLAVEAGFGQVLPFFTSRVTYDDFGNRHVDYFADAIFTGLELWVLPVVLPNDEVRMTLQPTFSFAAGTVQGPNGEQIPVVRYETVATTVTVPDGEPFVIGGMRNLRDEATTRFKGLLQDVRAFDSANPMMIVTPHILHSPAPE